MKHRRPLILLLLGAILISTAQTSACSGNDPEEIVEPQPVSEQAITLLKTFSLVRPDLSDEIELEAALRINREYDLSITTDWVKRGEAVPDSNVELLVGDTNRTASVDALRVLTDYRGNNSADYIIRVNSEKIVIVGGSSEATCEAVDYFLTRVLPELDEKMLTDGYEHIMRKEYALERLAGRSAGDFTILIGDDDKLREYAEAIQARVRELTGFVLPISTEKYDTPAVLSLGATGSALHAQAVRELKEFRKNCATDWLVRADRDGIVAAGVSEDSTDAAVEYFINTVCPELEAGSEKIEFISRKDYDMITLNKRSIGDYSILLDKGASVDLVNAATRLKAQVLEQTGFELPIVREAVDAPMIKLAVDDGELSKATAKFDGDDLVISGGHYLPVAKAAAEFTSLLKGDVDIAGDYAYNAVSDNVPLICERYPEMTLVWNDEFDYDEDQYDRMKWLQRAQMSATDMYNSTTERNVNTEDGNLVMRSYKENEEEIGKPYSTNMSMTTRDSCNYCYGYLEMRAKVPFGKGYWPSFWMVQREDMRDGANWMSEIDIFEVFGSTDRLVPNIHKWYNNTADNYHVQLGDDRKKPYIFKDIENLSDEYHVYGFYWDEKKMIFSVDGEDYCEFDITEESGDFGKYKGMSGFHTPNYIILNNFLFTPLASWIPEGRMVDDSTEYPSTYTVDYMRLWQGENGIMRAPNLEALEAENTAK